MTDLRQGVTSIEHAVLDQVEIQRRKRRHSTPQWWQVANDASMKAQFALRVSNPSGQRECLINAAARLIMAAELLGAPAAKGNNDAVQEVAL